MTINFNQTFIDEITARLTEEETRLTRELEQFSKKDPHNTENFNTQFEEVGDKEDENAAEVATYSDNLTLERELEAALRDVHGALDRLKKGTYGICKYCGKQIDERRLKARPMSSACVECKKLLTQEV